VVDITEKSGFAYEADDLLLVVLVFLGIGSWWNTVQ
jgi:hypothetical protein